MPAVNPTVVLVAFGAFVALLILGAVLGIIARHHLREGRRDSGQKPSMSPRLKILAAHYGIAGGPPGTDQDVTGILQNQPRDAITVLVTNNLFGCDPMPHKPKRLQVTYSYAESVSKTVTRPEGEFLVLPEDYFRTGDISSLQRQLDDERRTNKDEVARLMRRIQELEDEKSELPDEVVLPDSSPLVIQSAKYGPSERAAYGTDWEDVTDIVRGYIKGNAIDLLVVDGTFPEVVTGMRRMLGVNSLRYMLKVTYSFGNLKDHTVVRFSGDHLVLPDPPPSSSEES